MVVYFQCKYFNIKSKTTIEVMVQHPLVVFNYEGFQVRIRKSGYFEGHSAFLIGSVIVSGIFLEVEQATI